MHRPLSFYKDMKRIIFVSNEIQDEIAGLLEGFGEVRMLPPHKDLPNPIASHADILTFVDGGGTLYTPKDYFADNRELFEGARVHTVDECLGKEYPEDIYLDALGFKEHILCRSLYTAKAIKEGKNIVEVKQGYAKCSVCLLGETGAITADRGLASALEKLGAKVLVISSGGIGINTYSYGFIGGASAVIDKTVVFFGNVKDHPDGSRILDFVESMGYNAVYPEDHALADYGSAAVVYKEEK